MRTISHQSIVDLHRKIAAAHLQINGFFRFNWSEITGKFRSGIETPALLLESHSTELAENSNKTTHFNERRISFMLLDFTGSADNYTKQEEVLDELENVALDIIAYLVTESKNRNSFLFGKFEASSVSIEKVGPIFDNMFGWNILYTIKNHEPMCYQSEKWDWNISE